MRKALAILVCLLACCSVVSAQAVAGLGAISGSVRDASGAGVPGAEVVVANPAKGIRRVLTSNEAGMYSAPSLVPASGYSVTINKQGFSEFQAKEIDVFVGQNVRIDAALQVAGTTTQIQVEAAAPVVDSSRTDVSQVVDTTQIDQLPINGRRVDSFVLMTPGVSNDGYYGNLSFRGMAGNTSFLLDGVDNTEQFYNENAGRTRIASQISQDAVQEFQVVSSNFSAEYGRASAGVVNTVTRSGTNDLHGTGYWFFRNRSFNARDRYAVLNPPEVRHQAGGSLGGAILKDKLFYFVNTEIQRRNFPIASSLNRPAVIDPGGHFLTCGSPATPGQCAAINSILPRFYGTLPRENNQELAFGKLDWRPTERNAFSASFNFLHFVAPNGIQSAASINTGAQITSNGNDSVRVRNGRFSWTGIPKNNVVNEFRFGWFTDRQADDFNPAVQTAGLGYVSLTVAGQGLGAGASYLPRVSPNEQRFQFADSVSWIHGKHSFKFGVDIAQNHDLNYYMSNQFGSYTYGNVTAFALDFSGNTTGTPHWQNYYQTFGNPTAEFNMRDHGFYAQDQFRVTPRLTLNYGIRYEFTTVDQPTVTNPDYSQTGQIPTAKLNFAPRAGIAYALDKSGKTVVRAGFGMYHQRYPGMLISSLFSNNAVFQKSLTLTSSQYAAGPIFPNSLASSAAAKAGSTVEFADPNLRTPYTEQGTLAIERQVGKDAGLTVSYLWNRGIQGFGVRDLNMGALGPDVTYQIADATGGIVGAYATPTYLYANRVDKRYTRILQVENGVNSYYNALAVQFRKRFNGGLQTWVAYTWAHEIDYKQGSYQDNQGFSSIDSYANSWNGNYKADKGSGLLDQRHRMTINFVETPIFTHRQGAFYTYVVNNWQLSGIVTLAAGRPTTAYITVSDNYPFTGAAFSGSINGFGGNSRVPFWSTAPLYTPAYYRGDARLSKILPFSERYKLYLNFEAFNLTNTQYDTSLNGQAYTLKGGILRPTPALGVGRATAGFPDGTNARRAQVSARFIF